MPTPTEQPQQTKGHTILLGKSIPQVASAISGRPTTSAPDSDSQGGGGNSEAGEVGAGGNGTGDIRAEDIGTKDAETINAELKDAEPGQTNYLSETSTDWTSNAETNYDRASRAAHDNRTKWATSELLERYVSVRVH